MYRMNRLAWQGLPTNAVRTSDMWLGIYWQTDTQVTIPAAREDRPRREFGFVHFKERSSAVSVVESGETFTLDGNELNVRVGAVGAALVV